MPGSVLDDIADRPDQLDAEPFRCVRISGGADLPNQSLGFDPTSCAHLSLASPGAGAQSAPGQVSRFLLLQTYCRTAPFKLWSEPRLPWGTRLGVVNRHAELDFHREYVPNQSGERYSVSLPSCEERGDARQRPARGDRALPLRGLPRKRAARFTPVRTGRPTAPARARAASARRGSPRGPRDTPRASPHPPPPRAAKD